MFLPQDAQGKAIVLFYKHREEGGEFLMFEQEVYIKIVLPMICLALGSCLSNE
jgi:hypothetical protein